jgi:glycosyltransferase A (GT-A) superfamily protein (DUF2064 family)
LGVVEACTDEAEGGEDEEVARPLGSAARHRDVRSAGDEAGKEMAAEKARAADDKNVITIRHGGDPF